MKSPPSNPANLTIQLGGKWHQHYGVSPCPVCQADRRKDQNALTISGNAERLLLHCKKSNCDFKDIVKAAGILTEPVTLSKASAQAADRERHKASRRKLDQARSLWNGGAKIEGTLAEAYLRARGITCKLPQNLRWIPKAYHSPSGSYCGAMVANVIPTGGIHRTFFSNQGVRLDQSAKMMLGPCAGGGVPLSDTEGTLVVCEGIETGLSLLSGLIDGPLSVIAALSTTGIKTFQLPSKPGALIIAMDGDAPGINAGNSLASRAHASGWNVSTLTAPDGQDWNNILQQEVLK